jgi:NhaA family Na+:H+ antiporter
MPAGANWAQLYGVAAIAGIGFTMSLFIGGLAFDHASFDAPIRLGVLVGSIASGIIGYLLLVAAGRNERAPSRDSASASASAHAENPAG